MQNRNREIDLCCEDCGKIVHAKTRQKQYCFECLEKHAVKARKKYYRKTHINLKIPFTEIKTK